MENSDLVYVLKTYSGPKDPNTFFLMMLPIFVGIFSFIFMRISDRYWLETPAKFFRFVWVATSGYYIALAFYFFVVFLRMLLLRA